MTRTRGERIERSTRPPERMQPGQMRLSNYLLWQTAYSELVFRDELWPDFGRKAFLESLESFEGRDRRFGGRK